jgi:hypothetical protein
MKHGRHRGNILRRWEWLRRWCNDVWAQLWVGICGTTLGNPFAEWWAWVDLNHRPRPYQGRALAT